MKAAGAAGFWHLPLTVCRKIAKAELALTLTGTEAEQLFQLIQATMDCSAHDAACFLGGRCSDHLGDEDNQNAMLNTTEVDEALSREDWDVATKCVQDFQSKSNLQKELQDKIFAVVQKHKKSKGKFSGSKVPFPALADDMQPEAILMLMPEGSRLRLDRFNGRWHAFFRCPHTKTVKALSRSWGVRGHVACIQGILAWSWGLAEGYGMACPYELDGSALCGGRAEADEARPAKVARCSQASAR